MDRNQFSLTAYEIELKARVRGIKGTTLGDLENKDEYLDNPSSFLEVFLESSKSAINTETTSLQIYKENGKETKEISGYNEIYCEVDYGRNGVPFKVRDNDKNDVEYNKKAKIIHNYKVIFYHSKEKQRIYLIAFRAGYFSCKTAILGRMKNFLSGTSIQVDMKPISIPESLMDYSSIDNIVSLEYLTIYSQESEDLSEEPKTKIERKPYSKVQITFGENIKFRDRLKELGKSIKDLFCGTIKKEVINILRADLSDKLAVDEDSLKLLIDINGCKRTIALSEAESILYDYQISDDIELDNKGYATKESVCKVSSDYFKKILEERRRIE